MDNNIEILAAELGQSLLQREWKLSTAESCTAGGVAYAITTTPGSSAWFERGFVTYSNLSKEELLNVSASTLQNLGAVSEETAREMAEGALSSSQAQISIATTGIAGPDGGSLTKPVGTVWFAIATINQPTFCFKQVFSGNREDVRKQSIIIALENLINFLQE
jgi:nicotinamide-nucleotide amidase